MTKIDDRTQAIRLLLGFGMMSVVAVAFLESERFSDSMYYGTVGDALVIGMVPRVVAFLSVGAIITSLIITKRRNPGVSPSVLHAALLFAHSAGIYRNSIFSSYDQAATGSRQSSLGGAEFTQFLVLFLLQTVICSFAILMLYKVKDYRNLIFVTAILLLVVFPSILFSVLG